MSVIYLYFNRDFYKDRENFQFPYGITIYCAETDKIYRPQCTGPNSTYFAYNPKVTPAVSVRKSKLIYFGNNHNSDVSPGVENFLNRRANTDNYDLTSEEFERAITAAARYKADKVGSLSWPFKEPHLLIERWYDRSPTLSSPPMNIDKLLLREGFDNLAAPKLPGKPVAKKFVAGKGMVNLTGCDKIIQQMARL